jgi:hypothetical protein
MKFRQVLTPDQFDSLREVNKGDAQPEIPQLHWERLVSLGFLGWRFLPGDCERRIV